MKKLLTLTALAALMLLTACRTDKRTSQTADSFINDLMAQMTLEEKLGQLNLPVAGDLYGQTMTLSFIRRIRDEQHFPSLDALRRQIARDIEELKR